MKKKMHQAFKLAQNFTADIFDMWASAMNLSADLVRGSKKINLDVHISRVEKEVNKDE